MGFFFFLLSLLSAALSYNVLRPEYHHPRGIVVSFVLGWLVGELALHVIAVQIFIVFLWVLFGSVKGFWGALGLVLFIASWLLLAYHYFSGYKAKVLMDQIVIPHRRKEDMSAWGRNSEVDTARLLRPFSSGRSDDIEVIKNIVYQQVDGFKLKLDIRRKREPITNAPVLLQIHGGAWAYGYGSKNEQGLPLMVELAKQGWVCVAIDYRLSPHATFPDHIIDCKKALVWVKEHIAEYGGNAEFIVATGSSAGAHLASLLALTPNLPVFQPGFEGMDTTVQGCVPFGGIYDLLDHQKMQTSVALEIVLHKHIIKQTKVANPELYQLMSPLSHVNPKAPPFLIIHGDKDSLTALAEAQYFASTLDEVSRQSVEFAEISGAQHAFEIFSSLRSDYVLYGVAERLNQWYRDYQERGLGARSERPEINFRSALSGTR